MQKISCSFYASLFILFKNTIKSFHLSLCTKLPLGKKKHIGKRASRWHCGTSKRNSRKSHLKNASLGTVFNHLLLNQCNILFLLNATHAQLNKQNHRMWLHCHTSPETNLLCSGTQIQLALYAKIYNPRFEKMILI